MFNNSLEPDAPRRRRSSARWVAVYYDNGEVRDDDRHI